MSLASVCVYDVSILAYENQHGNHCWRPILTQFMPNLYYVYGSSYMGARNYFEKVLKPTPILIEDLPKIS